MVFTSHVFIFIFLPLFLATYYITPNRFRSFIIVAGSYLFYAWWSVAFAFLFIGVTLWNYFIYKQIIQSPHTKKWMQWGVAGNLLTLGIFKYLGFGVNSFNQALGVLNIEPISFINIILPIGISFYIFQAISFLIDIYRKDAPYPKNFIDFCAYLSLFPQLIAGPILRYKDMASQFYNRIHTFDKFSEGAYRFMVGFAQKVLIADSIARLSDQIFTLDNPTFIEAWLGTLSFTAQIYFDFLGYSSMAIGLGLMMGFRFVENFNHPYLARSITEFWRRWHISLSAWLKDYLYIPLGGNRKGKTRTYINLMITMILGGVWHGANLTFMLWGAWHGFLLALERAFGVKRKQMSHFLMVMPTLVAVMIGWVLFKSNTLLQAMSFYKGMVGLNGFALSDFMNWQLNDYSVFMLCVAWVLIFIHPKYLEFREKMDNNFAMKTTGHHNIFIVGCTIILFLMSLIKLSAGTYSPFLYFQF